MDSFTSSLVCQSSTFLSFTSAYNHLFKCREEYITGKKRCVLIEQRLIDSWLYYRLLKFHEKFSGRIHSFIAPYMKDLDERIREIKNKLFPLFINRWAGKTKFF